MKIYNLVRLSFALLILISANLKSAEIEFITLSEDVMKFPISLNSDGTILVGETGSEDGAIWHMDGTTENIGGRSANGIGDNGMISGTIINSDGVEEAAYYLDGEWHSLGLLPNSIISDLMTTTSTGISDNGEFISGMGWVDSNGAPITEPFTYSIEGSNGLVGLGTYENESGRANCISNDGSVVAGWSRTSTTSRRPAYWVDGEINFIEDATFGDIMNMTSDGSAFVGTSGNAFIWTEETGRVELPPPPGSLGTIGLAIAEDHTVVGTIRDGMQPMFWRAMIKTPTGEVSKVTDYFTNNFDVPEEFSNYTLLQSNTISADGKTLSGFGFDSDYNWITWIIKVPDVENGTITGYVNLDGGYGDAENSIINFNGSSVHPDETGYYELELFEGTYSITANHFGYEPSTIEDIVVEAGSVVSGQDFNLIAQDESINLPQNLAVDGDTGVVTWDAPEEGNFANLSWDNGTHEGSIGLSGAGTMMFSHYWDTANLNQYSGAYIKRFQFIPTEADITYSFTIWNSTNQVLYQQDVTEYELDTWNTIEMDGSYVVDPLNPIFIGFVVEQESAISPAAYDEGPSSAGYGNMFFSQNSWGSLPYNWNWNICAIVTDNDGRTYAMDNKSVATNNDFPIFEDIDFISTKNYTPNNRPLGSYNIYLDNFTTPIAENITETSYTLENLEEETDYSVGVSSVYQNGEESDIVIKDFTYMWEPAHLNPVNLSVDPLEGKLSWELPQMWFHYDNGTNFDGIGLEESDGTEFGIAVRWDSDQMADYHNAVISKINFYPLSDAVNYELRVWSGSDISNNIIYSQMVDSYQIDEWNIVELDEPVVVDSSNEIWVGFWITDCPPGELVAAGDEGPAVNDYGNKIYLPAFQGWRNLAQFGFDYNWNIQVLFEANDSGLAKFALPETVENDKSYKGLVGSDNPASSKEQSITSFNIYLDGEQVATDVTEMEYTFENLVENQTYNAGVEAIYSDGDSDIITTEFTYIGVVSVEENIPSVSKLHQNYPNPFNPATTINYQVAMGGVINLSVYNANGELVTELVKSNHKPGHYSIEFDGTNLSSGIYYYSIKGSNFNSTKKMILVK